MVERYLTALLAMAIITGLWLSVQRWWLRRFPEQASGDGDALAGRSGCHACDCGGGTCKKD